MRVDVCIVTCRRPKGLQRLLGALQEIRPPDGCVLRVVVVDNDAGESARPICAELGERLRWPLCYRTEKRRGIPQARNTALATSIGEADFVAFLDDDETPDPDWLAELLRTVRAFGAEAVTGPVRPVFERPPARWIGESRLFEGVRRETGTRLPSAYTHNVLISTRALSTMDALFDERMALIGSSDGEFFERFAAAGHRIVWCDSARVSEWIPPSRARLGWLLRRALRVGASRTWIDRQRSRSALRGTRIAAHGGWCLLKGAAIAFAALPRGLGGVACGLQLACYGAGRLAGLTGWTYPEYRRIHGG